MASRLLYLARHGEADRGPELPDGNDDGPLTERGLEQAQCLADRLDGVPFAAIHHSTLARAVRTAEVVATRHPGVPLHPDDLLRECIPSVPDRYYLTAGQVEFFDSWSDLPAALVDGPAQAAAAFGVYACPVPDAPAGAPSSGPDHAGHGDHGGLGGLGDQRDQGAPADEEPVVRELVISHGNLINAFVAHAVDGPPWTWLNLVDDYCALTVVLYRAGQPPRLLAYNDTGHLPAHLRGVGRPASWRV